MTHVQNGPEVDLTTSVAPPVSATPAARGPLRKLTSAATGLERRAFALMTDTAANALLGIVFWAAAARLYSPTEVGRGSAIITAATLLATLSQLNLGNVYARFLGSAGSRQRRLVFQGYGVIGGLGLLLGTAYATLGPGELLFTSSIEAIVFPLCVAVLGVFVLQDMILISLHRAAWVPVENITWGLAKLALLVLVASSLPSDGIVVSWVVPAVVAVVIITGYLIFRRWKHGNGTEAFPGRKELTKAIGGEYATGLISTAVPLLLPLIVVHRMGLEANAYFSVPWLFASSLSLLMWNIASILLVEASAAPDRLPRLLGRALRLSLAVAVVGGVGIWFLGPPILGLLGPGYEASSTWLLRITALASPAIAVVVVWTTATRARGQLRRVMILQAAVGSGTVGLTSLLIGPLGVTGVGVAYFVSQTTAALFLLRPLLALIGGRKERHVGKHRRKKPATVPRGVA